MHCTHRKGQCLKCLHVSIFCFRGTVHTTQNQGIRRDRHWVANTQTLAPPWRESRFVSTSYATLNIKKRDVSNWKLIASCFSQARQTHRKLLKMSHESPFDMLRYCNSCFCFWRVASRTHQSSSRNLFPHLLFSRKPSTKAAKLRFKRPFSLPLTKRGNKPQRLQTRGGSSSFFLLAHPVPPQISYYCTVGINYPLQTLEDAFPAII